MQSPRAWLSRVWDVRAGEWLAVILSFLVLLLIISAHTILETTRDTLLLTKLPARQLGLVYIAVAVCALPSAALAGHASKRFGPRRALVGGLVVASLAAVAFFVLPANRGSVIALYVGSALIATMVVPQFWTLLDAGLTVAQARRLFGPIASAGVIGGVLGSSIAAAVLPWVPVKMLLLGSGAIFLTAAGAVAFFPLTDRPVPAPTRQGAMRISMADVRQEPFLLRLTLVVAVSTAAVLAVDYFFKWTVARTVSPAHIASFVSRYYAALNIASLIVQLFLAAALVRKVGLAAAIVVTPVFLAFGALTALVFGGTLLAVLTMKGIDGSLRYSVHRITTELLYLPLGPGLRARAKPIIDGAVVRVSQALTAALILALGGTAFLSPRIFAAIVVVLGVAWAAIAFAIRGPYLDLLRDAVSDGAADRRYSADPLDLTSAEVLVEFLASSEPLEVIAAMNTLVRRGRARLVPALILYHHDERVLRRALEILSTSPRSDWVTLAGVLLDHPSEAVRMAVTRAFATRGWLQIERLASDTSPRVQGYATLTVAVRDRPSDVLKDSRIAAILERPGQAGEEARLGLLTAIADAASPEPLADLLLELTKHEPQGRGSEWIELAARAAVHRSDARLVPFLIAHLTMRQGREAVREALAGLGDPAFDAVWKTLGDGTQDRRLRVQLPATLAAFGSKAAADRLLENVETELDGLVRYKSIRALARVVVFANVRVSRQRVEKLARANLVEYFQILGRRLALQTGQMDARADDGGLVAMTGRLLPGLLDDKLDHSLERAFRLLKIAHPREDIHRIYIACRSNDRHARASAGELLDALFTHRDQQQLRALLRLVADDLTPAERIARSLPYLAFAPPPTHDAAVLELIEDHDVGVAALAALYATGLGRPALVDAAEAARERRSEIGLTAVRLFERPDASADVGALGGDQAAHG
jgi:AAA family ATP:ADP antiporter